MEQKVFAGEKGVEVLPEERDIVERQQRVGGFTVVSGCFLSFVKREIKKFAEGAHHSFGKRYT